jgi:hypothetical protein
MLGSVIVGSVSSISPALCPNVEGLEVPYAYAPTPKRIMIPNVMIE